jgi:hypothetical protein
MNSCLTWHMSAAKSNLTRLQTGDSGRLRTLGSPLWENALAGLANATDSIWARDRDTEKTENEIST